MNRSDSLTIAIFPFQGDPALSQLSFPKGATIQVVSKNSDWWYGSWNEQRGWFPKSYCRPTDRDSPENNTSTGTTTTSTSDFERQPIMGGTGEIHGAARNFGTSPTFNPGLEDSNNNEVSQYAGYNNPFDNHPKTDFEKAVLSKNAAKRKLFRGIKIGVPTAFPLAAKRDKEDTVQPAVRITPSAPSGRVMPLQVTSPPFPTPDSHHAAVGRGAPPAPPATTTTTTIPPPLATEFIVLEQRALMDQETVRRQHELLERQQEQIRKLEQENDKYKTKWWKRGTMKKAE